MVIRRFIFPLLLLLSVATQGEVICNDSLSIMLLQADSLFLSGNLSLLAEKCNISAVKAQIIQAKLFTNFTISGTNGLFNTEYRVSGGRKWMDLTDKGETSTQIKKLVHLAGKRNKQIEIAELTADREEEVYFDLLRTLKYSLRSDFYNLYFLQQIYLRYG
jgi:outer membrane protein, heavy metal efflux system